jgi:type IV secretory pathway component VirB8
MPKAPQGITALEQHLNTPPAIYSEGVDKFAEIYGGAMLSQTRFFVISVLSVLALIICATAIVVMTPLREVVPYVVEVEPGKGVVNKPIEVQKITPQQSVIKSELARWADAVYTIDPLRTQDNYRWANARARDKAVSQFAEFRTNEKVYERIQKEPGLVREVVVSSVDASQKGIAFVFLQSTERGQGGGVLGTKRHRLTLHYEIDPPKEESALLLNPLGIYVTFFNATEEASK